MGGGSGGGLSWAMWERTGGGGAGGGNQPLGPSSSVALGLLGGSGMLQVRLIVQDHVEDGSPCGPSMMCLDHKCLSIQSLNLSTCPVGPNTQVCSAHGVCNNEATCTCDSTWAGTDCSMPDPPKEPEATEDEGPKGPSATNLIIGSIAGAILVAAIVLGGTGWGFKNVKKRRYDPNASAI
ncbi:unnamed protein product [Gadus morhua 'NCC']